MKRLFRSTQDSMISGVCGGLGEYFNVDPTLIRLGFIVSIFTPLNIAAILGYIAGTVIVPEDSGYEVVDEKEKEEE